MGGKGLMLVSAIVLLLFAGLYAYETAFCAGALHGDFGGCLSMTAGNFAREPLKIAAVAMAVAGLLVGARLSRK